jgi:hypothetical protein
MLSSPPRSIGMPRRIILLASLCAASCSFDVDGSGNNPNLGPDSASGSTSDDAESGGDPSTTDPPATSSEDEESGTSLPSETTDDPPGEPARLVFAPDELDFGNIAAGGDEVRELVMRNAGGSTALIITNVLIPSAFGLANGYPGAGGDCGEELAPGQSCTLGVGFHPDAIGPYAANLDIAYYDGIDLGQPVTAPPVPLRGGGVGETENLVVNPSAESSIDAWTMMDSTWEAITGDFVDGSYAFEAGNPALGVTTLTQTIGLGAWTDPLATGGMHFRFGGSAKAPESGSAYRVDLDFGTGAVTPMMGTSAAWDTANVTGPVPIGATSVTITLQCTAGALNACGARFDALALSLVYPPPA